MPSKLPFRKSRSITVPTVELKSTPPRTQKSVLPSPTQSSGGGRNRRSPKQLENNATSNGGNHYLCPCQSQTSKCFFGRWNPIITFPLMGVIICLMVVLPLSLYNWGYSPDLRSPRERLDREFWYTYIVTIGELILICGLTLLGVKSCCDHGCK